MTGLDKKMKNEEQYDIICKATETRLNASRRCLSPCYWCHIGKNYELPYILDSIDTQWTLQSVLMNKQLFYRGGGGFPHFNKICKTYSVNLNAYYHLDKTHEFGERCWTHNKLPKLGCRCNVCKALHTLHGNQRCIAVAITALCVAFILGTAFHFIAYCNALHKSVPQISVSTGFSCLKSGNLPSLSLCTLYNTG